ncbi:hypothetical protein SAMN04488543_2467 [Friedmanniella luteola]|uniref:Cyclophilin-like domain-containing protein n=1 Tax=Friedmanniella luteola TaxID=546871 RepID=A0A1H1VFP3_9ACTN|nr:cyclophilin-like fold protein [Friedmanniella luteola]SDS83226.1 hypothetical protein SAMN04488543_2467 [Friedmanniella luteola]
MNTVERRSRADLCRAAALIPTTALLVVATLALAAVDRALPPVPAPVAAPTVGRPAPPPAGQTRAVLQLADGPVDIALEDTSAGRQLAALLPLRLTFRDPMGQAKSARLPRPLTVPGSDRVLDPEGGALYYWPPSQDLAILYDDLGQTVPPPGLVRLGTVTSGLTLTASAGIRFVALLRPA